MRQDRPAKAKELGSGIEGGRPSPSVSKVVTLPMSSLILTPSKLKTVEAEADTPTVLMEPRRIPLVVKLLLGTAPPAVKPRSWRVRLETLSKPVGEAPRC